MLGETAAFLNCKQTFIIRTSWLFGYTGKNFVRTMIKFGITKGQLKVINDQIGTPTNANDLAMAMLKLALTDKYGVYHFANSGQCSWFEFANFIIKEAEIQCIIEPCTSTEYITKATRPKCSILDNRKISLIVGTIRSWQDATRDFVEKIADEIKELKHFGKESL